jgi:hypothetical protein
MFPNGRFWGSHIRSDFIPALQRTAEIFLNRILPTFRSGEDEAAATTARAYEDLISGPADGSKDLAEFAEVADQAGDTYYTWLKELEQSMLNACAMFLSHLFEQQMMMLLRRELLLDHERANSRLFTFDVAGERIRQHGIEISKFSSWPVLTELRLLANVVKHGDGRSAEQLHVVAPELFEPPMIRGMKLGGIMAVKPSVFTPLLGNDIYVTVDGIARYQVALEDFWRELAARVERP